MTGVAAPLTAEHAWHLLGDVQDPEIPVVSVVELGIVREIAVHGATVDVTLTPTYAGCPATDVIAGQVAARLREGGATDVRITTRIAPPWTTDWIAPAARERLRGYGIVPPHRADPGGARPLRFVPPPRLACPRCGSGDTERLSEFGATPCKALYRCRACREPFEYFKPL